MMTHIRRSLILPIAAAALSLGACDDPTVVDDHFDVEGFALFEGDTELYRYMLDDGAAPTLTLTQGVHDVLFIPLNHDGEPLAEEGNEEEDEHELRITIADSGILTWTPEAHGVEAHDFVIFEGELNALQAGNTSMEVCVPHGLHCDFEVTVPVTVMATQ